MKKIAENTCIRLIPRTNQPDYAEILNKKGQGCYASIGRFPGKNVVMLESNDDQSCIQEDTVIHELFHVIGLWHEHMRADRDAFINVLYKNIEPAQYPQFEKLSSRDATTYNVPYDYKSVMHYDETAFAKPGKISMMTKDTKFQMYFMSRFLELDSHRYYGYGIFYDLIMGKGWKESSNFPVVTYCDMQIRILGHVQRHTVQCVLVINIFTEKFVRDYIKIDGIFVLRMITIHSGILMCTDIVDTMWDQYLQESGHEVIREILEDKGYGDDYDRSASAGGLSIDPGIRRKTSVLVPLMSREDLNMDQSPPTPTPQFLRPPSSRMTPNV
uniref:Metalloendopeptidase n=1 Tax=Caenorhabditis tropicalis TaxID=1561998 RepID=A0A1I7THD0_9PELO